MNKKFETIATEQLVTSTGGNFRGWAVNHPYRAERFLDHHPNFDARWSANHPFAAARIARRTGC